MQDNFLFEYSYRSNINAEQALWRAVILQAFTDLKNNSRKRIAKTYRLKAALWFNLNNDDFIAACCYAGFSPDFVWREAEKIKDNFYNSKPQVA